jgi:nickel-dependent lactate racemase
MDTHSVKIPHLAWFGDTEMELTFPDNWDVCICDMKGKDARPLKDEDFRKAFSHPTGTDPIRELARGKKEVAIAFDDISRPTKVGQIARYVLEELKEAGTPDSAIRFIVALGAHGAHSLIDFRKKLGDEILDRFPIYNHNPYECCKHLGNTALGTPVDINAEFMQCDLKIGIGAIIPHVSYGFGGGGKVLLPGLASMDSMWHNHYKVGGRSAPTKDQPLGKLNPTVGLGKYEGNVLRLDMEEATRLAGFDIKIDAIVNYRRDTVALFVGDPIKEHAVGVKMAMGHYWTDKAQDMDIVITNSHAKANEGHIATFLGARMLKNEGGDLVSIVGAPAGQVPHYLVRSGGKFVGGRIWGRKDNFPLKVKRFFLVSEYSDLAGWEWFGPVEQINWVKSWEEALITLQRDHGTGTKVAVIPDGTIQYFL